MFLMILKYIFVEFGCITKTAMMIIQVNFSLRQSAFEMIVRLTQEVLPLVLTTNKKLSRKTIPWKSNQAYEVPTPVKNKMNIHNIDTKLSLT